MLPNRTRVHSPEHSKTDLLVPDFSEGKDSTYCKAPSKQHRQLTLKRPKLPDGFQGSVFKGKVKERACRVPDQLTDVLLTGWW